MPTPFVFLPLGAQDRTGFACGTEALDQYFRRQVGQDVRRSLTACFVAVDKATQRIAGFYTLSAAAIALTDLPPDLVTRVPRYPTLPAARLGRLAVALDYKGQGLGATLLADAVMRSAASDVAVFALVVDAKDDIAASFYRHHGFTDYASAPGRLLAPLAHLLPPR